MTLNALTSKIILSLTLICSAPMAYALYPKEDVDFLTLPDYCAVRLQEKYQGTDTYKIMEKRLAGNGGLHHYCAGLFTYQVALRMHDESAKRHELQQAILEMNYPFHHGMSNNFVLRPKMHYDIGKVYEELGDFKNALENYYKSIELNPNIWLPYAAICDLQIKLNNTQAAIEIIEKGLTKKPKSKPLLKRLAKLKK